MNKLAMTAAGVALAGATALATMPANAWWGGNNWGGGPWHGGPWYGGYPYYGGWGGYPYGGWGGYPHGGWGGYPYGGWGGYPHRGWGYPYAVTPVAPVAVRPATSSAAK